MFHQLKQSCIDDLNRVVSLPGDSKFSLVYLTQTGAFCKLGLMIKRTQESRHGGLVYTKIVYLS